MALGLGFANPELRRAQMLAQLNGSTALPRGAGTSQPPTPAPTETPPPSAVGQIPMPEMPVVGPGGRPSPQDVQQLPLEMPMVGPGAPQQQGAAQPPQVEKGASWAQIAGAIGHVLLSADAGYHGRALPKYNDPMKAEQDEAMREAEFLINTTARGWEVARKAPPGQREGMLQAFEQAIARVAPDFDFRGFIDGLETDAERMDTVAPQLATMSPEAKEMFMAALRARGGDATAAAELLKDEQFMNTLTDFEDRRNSPVVNYKLQAIKAASAKIGVDPETFKNMTADDFAALNDQLPEQARLTPSEISTLKRNPQLGAAIGLRNPAADEENQTLDSRAGVTPAPAPRTQPGAARPPTPEPATQPARPPRAAGRPVTDRGPTAPPQAQPKAAKPAAKSKAQKPAGPPIMPEGEGAVYNRPGYRPEYADPAFQRAVQGEAAKRGVPREQVSQAMSVRQADAPSQQGGAPAQRFKAPKDMTIPGVGRVKAGEVVIYDPATGKYRRG